jgi:hypothetical protein
MYQIIKLLSIEKSSLGNFFDGKIAPHAIMTPDEENRKGRTGNLPLR